MFSGTSKGFAYRLIYLVLVAAGLSAAAFGGAISVDGLCEVGNCASPDVLSAGSSISSPFSFTYTFADTDSYQVTGTLTASDTMGSGFSLFVAGPTVTYLGNGGGTVSGADTLTIDFLQNFVVSFTAGSFSESIAGTFGGALASGSSAAGQDFLDGHALPLMGPFPSSAPFSESFNNVSLSGLTSPLLFDARFTDVFAAGSAVGATINSNPTVPEPATAGLMLAGLTALIGLRERSRARR